MLLFIMRQDYFFFLNISTFDFAHMSFFWTKVSFVYVINLKYTIFVSIFELSCEAGIFYILFQIENKKHWGRVENTLCSDICKFVSTHFGHASILYLRSYLYNLCGLSLKMYISILYITGFKILHISLHHSNV